MVGFIFKKTPILKAALSALEKRFGKIDFQSKPLYFTYTDYYGKEMGRNLLRVFVSFKKLILASELASIKIFTNRIEAKFLSEKNRLINIDPGYLELSKLVLATTKDFSHRIYLKDGIFAEVTLYYAHKTFRPRDWTYPDYRTQEYLSIFNKIREIYGLQIKDI
ncbi:MAG: hypothetical protein AMJ95_04330 [Omnitrophica WOR_2 bacterium SM23_72]|nr:MAG: hypothetical protein AMJ95_04330 [Omnitrophica WOR_2 bacterium SM23_72]